MSSQTKIVVFDLDETLGYFTEFGMFWNGINSYINSKNIDIILDQYFFNKLLELYPEFIRPNIMNILNYLKKKKRSLHCEKVIIYTNNQGPRNWTIMIKDYFENKLKYKLFDQIIGAFKINGKQIELCRTSHLKSHKDLVKCIKIPPTTQICFLDDVYYPDMKHKNVYYINIKPYIHDLSFNVLINRFLNSSLVDAKWGQPTYMKEYLIKELNTYNYTYVEKLPKELVIDKIISKKIIQHLHTFFTNQKYLSNKTKHNRILKNKTIKRKKILT
jgi:hypothetical protein